jgi:uncharacterized membrane protein YkgB
MNIRTRFEKIDDHIIHTLRRISMPAARISLFIVFFWFGVLKIIGTSPANPLVSGLLEQTLPFISFNTFIVVFAVYEMVIGIAFLIPRCERFALALLVLHMITTVVPLFLLTSVTWQGFLTPTLEGQYILKNLVIIALGIGVAAHLSPMTHERR